MRRLIVPAYCLAMLAACSNPHSDESTTAAKSGTQARQKTVFDDQLKALEKAKAVEKQMQDDKEKQDEAIEDQGG